MPITKKNRYPEERKKVAEWLKGIFEPEGIIVDFALKSLTTKQIDKLNTIQRKSRDLFDDLT